MTVLLALVRFLHMVSLALLMGILTFLLVVAGPALSQRKGLWDAESWRFHELLRKLAAWSNLLALLSALAWLGVQGAVMSGLPLRQALTTHIIGTVLARTAFGHVWALRLGLLVLLGVVLVRQPRTQDGWGWRTFCLAEASLACGAMAALAWAGHAAATEGVLRLPHLVADIIHLLATGVWLGGLLPLALLLRSARRSLTPPWATAAREAVRRFSCLGLVCVGALILTGFVNAWVLVGSFPGLVGTLYGHLLLVKLLLLILVIGVAAHNRFRILPGLLAPPPADTEAMLRLFLRRLGRNVMVESLLGAAILFLVGFLGITPPALHDQPTWPFSFRLSWGIPEDLSGGWLALLIGGLGVLFGFLALGYGFRHRQHLLWILVVGFGLIGFYGAGVMQDVAVRDAYPTTYRRSPVAYQVASIASGLRLYETNCAVCHGAEGYGDGPAGRTLRPRPADLTAAHVGHHTAGDLFWWLTHGIPGSAMPGFQDRLRETDRWDVINFLRALASGEQARSLGAQVEPTPWLIAPDFTFETGPGSNATLKEQRGKAVIHLVLFRLPGSRERLSQLAAARNTIAAGAQIVTVPMGPIAPVEREFVRALRFPMATDESPETAETYALFGRTAAETAAPAVPSHLEFLIDRQGYMRARWIPEQSPGWGELSRLLAEIDRLNKEPPMAPAPEEHVH